MPTIQTHAQTKQFSGRTKIQMQIPWTRMSQTRTNIILDIDKRGGSTEHALIPPVLHIHMRASGGRRSVLSGAIASRRGRNTGRLHEH